MPSGERESLLKLCEKGKWQVIIDSIPDKILSWDFEEKNKEGDNALRICVKKKAIQVIPQIISAHNKNKSSNTPSLFLLEVINGNSETLKWIVENQLGFSILSERCNDITCVLSAVANGHLETLKWLIARGFAIGGRNINGDSCTLLAAAHGHLEILKWLLDNGGPMDDFDIGCSIDDRNHKLYSCTLLAASNGHLEVLKCLVDNRCSINDRNYQGIHVH